MSLRLPRAYSTQTMRSSEFLRKRKKDGCALGLPTDAWYNASLFWNSLHFAMAAASNEIGG